MLSNRNAANPHGIWSAVYDFNCQQYPFRKDGAGIELRPGRLEMIVADLQADNQQTFVCHKTLDKERMTCMGAVGVMSKVGQLPVIARLGLAVGVITKEDIAASAAIVINPSDLADTATTTHF